MRQRFECGSISRKELLEVEAKSYHSPGTCNFYGTANSNQMLLEIMGLQLPGSAFVNPSNPLRKALTIEGTKQIITNTENAGNYQPIYKIISEKTIVNAIIGLIATGGSTNHTIHLIAIAKAAGIIINWEDFAKLSAITPSLCKIYPNGLADVNHFHAAGGTTFLIKELLNNGLLHEDVTTCKGKKGLSEFTFFPTLLNKKIKWKPSPKNSGDCNVLRSTKNPFIKQGGLKVLTGNIGYAILKTSALKPELKSITAKAIIFHSQEELSLAFKKGKLHKDFIAVFPYQGPKANGMPELHKLMAILGTLQDLGYKVGLITDGRMSGASGKIPAAIHICPEAIDGGVIAKVKNGDRVSINSEKNSLNLEIPQKKLNKRKIKHPNLKANFQGLSRELYNGIRSNITSANQGASFLKWDENE